MFYGDLQVQIVKKTRDKEHEPDYIITQMTVSQACLLLTKYYYGMKETKEYNYK